MHHKVITTVRQLDAPISHVLRVKLQHWDAEPGQYACMEANTPTCKSSQLWSRLYKAGLQIWQMHSTGTATEFAVGTSAPCGQSGQQPDSFLLAKSGGM